MSCTGTAAAVAAGGCDAAVEGAIVTGAATIALLVGWAHA